MDRMRDALGSWHMGWVIAAYRTHPFHGRPLSQELVGSWVRLTQAQLSRIENGPPLKDLDRLTLWARTLRIPEQRLWFKVRDHRPEMRSRVADGTFSPRNASAVNRRGLLAAGSVVAADACLSGRTRVAQALGVAMAPDGGGNVGGIADRLNELVSHYSHLVCKSPSTGTYDDLLGARSYAASLLPRIRRSERSYPDVLVAAGWLSILLAVATSYLGDHGAALVWCADAERRSQGAGHPELAGWAALIRATMAYYEGEAGRSVMLACEGQTCAPLGTVAYARLACQEMRARAMLGDADGMAQASRRASAGMDKLPPAVATRGTFSVALAEDPPYTATSLLLLRRFDQAVGATCRVLDATYPDQAVDSGRQTSNYARTLLVLGLAHAGLGHVAEAAAAGRAALDSARPVWPTLVLAGKLDQILVHDHEGVAEAADYHARFMDVSGRATDYRRPKLAQSEVNR